MKAFFFLIVCLFLGQLSRACFTLVGRQHFVQHEAKVASFSDSIYKVFRTVRANASDSFDERIVLRINSTFVYTLRAGILFKKIEGRWSINDSILHLANSDTSAEISIEERVIADATEGVRIFEITSELGGELGYKLEVKSKAGKTITRFDSKRHVDILVDSIASFKVSSVKEYEWYFPQAQSNSFRIVINTKRAILKEHWRLISDRLYPLNSESRSIENLYYLEEVAKSEKSK